jgi:hypothetical protein
MKVAKPEPAASIKRTRLREGIPILRGVVWQCGAHGSAAGAAASLRGSGARQQLAARPAPRRVEKNVDAFAHFVPSEFHRTSANRPDYGRYET